MLFPKSPLPHFRFERVVIPQGQRLPLIVRRASNELGAEPKFRCYPLGVNCPPLLLRVFEIRLLGQQGHGALLHWIRLLSPEETLKMNS